MTARRLMVPAALALLAAVGGFAYWRYMYEPPLRVRFIIWAASVVPVAIAYVVVAVAGDAALGALPPSRWWRAAHAVSLAGGFALLTFGSSPPVGGALGVVLKAGPLLIVLSCVLGVYWERRAA